MRYKVEMVRKYQDREEPRWEVVDTNLTHPKDHCLCRCKYKSHADRIAEALNLTDTTAVHSTVVGFINPTDMDVVRILTSDKGVIWKDQGEVVIRP